MNFTSFSFSSFSFMHPSVPTTMIKLGYALGNNLDNLYFPCSANSEDCTNAKMLYHHNVWTGFINSIVLLSYKIIDTQPDKLPIFERAGGVVEVVGGKI